MNSSPPGSPHSPNSLKGAGGRLLNRHRLVFWSFCLLLVTAATFFSFRPSAFRHLGPTPSPRYDAPPGGPHEAPLGATDTGAFVGVEELSQWARAPLLARAGALEEALEGAAAARGAASPSNSSLAARNKLEEATDQELAVHVAMLESLLSGLGPQGGGLRPPQGTLRAPLFEPGQGGIPLPARNEGNAPSCIRPELPKWCYAFQKCGVRNIALIGNGPLSAEQRALLSSPEFQVRIRFNFQNNKVPGEETDVWVMRFASRSKSHFWGISQMEEGEAREALREATSLWFLGYIDQPWNDHQHILQPAYRQFPEIALKHHMLLDHTELTNSSRLYKARREGFTPSSGFVGASYAMECAANATVHLFGFNWHASHAEDNHDIQGEERVLRAAAEDGSVVIHNTACTGLRACELPSTGERDCHVSGTNPNGEPVFKCLEKQQS